MLRNTASFTPAKRRHNQQITVGGPVGSAALLLLVMLVLLTVGSAARAVNLKETPVLAAQIAYRLDREQGPQRAARQHLLAWRLQRALADRELAAGDLIKDRVAAWEANLDLLAAGHDFRQLPAWFAPVELGAVEPLLLARLPQLDTAAWHPSQQRQAATVLARLATEDLPPEWVSHQYPMVLAWARDHAPMIWQSLLAMLAENPDWVPLVAPVFVQQLALPLEAPLADWLALEDLAGGELGDLDKPVSNFPLSLLARQARLLQSEELLVDIKGAPDLILAPYRLYRQSDQPMVLDLALLSLTRALAGTEAGRFSELVQTLAATVEIGLVEPSTIGDQRLTEMLQILRNVDSLLLNQMGEVDPALGDTYLRLRQLLGEALQKDPRDRLFALAELASLRAAADRHTADLAGYLAQPVRETLSADLDICMDISGASGQYPPEPITQDQFATCLDSFARWGMERARSAELAGDSGGPFEAGNIDRELTLPHWQRINYWMGYLTRRYDAQCGPFDETLVNPLEWALAANAYVWFGERWPAYMSDAGRTAQIDRLTSRGQSVLENLRRLDQCRRFGESPGRSALRVAMESYAAGMDGVVREIGNFTAEFRARELKAGADVRLEQGSNQPTNYRPENLEVQPCGGVQQCGMGRKLMPSRALLGLLPQVYLVADQLRGGSLTACYDNVRWIERRGQPSQVGNEVMARYFGHLSVDLHVAFASPDGEEPVRSMRLTSLDEYEYLFGANNQQVLDNSCPIDLVGTQVVSQLPQRGIRLVPDRLTFLTAGRIDPSQVFDRHWDAGNEWRDRFVTGEGVELLASKDGAELMAPVAQRLDTLYRQWNEQVYAALLNEDSADEAGSSASRSLGEAMAVLERERQVLNNLARLLAPRQSVLEPATRAALAGPRGLFQRDRARGMAREQVPVLQIAPLAMGFLEDARFLFGAGQRTQADPMITNALARLATLRARLAASGQN